MSRAVASRPTKTFNTGVTEGHGVNQGSDNFR
jgi:hypothetical protein